MGLSLRQEIFGRYRKNIFIAIKIIIIILKCNFCLGSLLEYFKTQHVKKINALGSSISDFQFSDTTGYNVALKFLFLAQASS